MPSPRRSRTEPRSRARTAGRWRAAASAEAGAPACRGADRWPRRCRPSHPRIRATGARCARAARRRRARRPRGARHLAQDGDLREAAADVVVQIGSRSACARARSGEQSRDTVPIERGHEPRRPAPDDGATNHHRCQTGGRMTEVHRCGVAPAAPDAGHRSHLEPVVPGASWAKRTHALAARRAPVAVRALEPVLVAQVLARREREREELDGDFPLPGANVSPDTS